VLVNGIEIPAKFRGKSGEFLPKSVPPEFQNKNICKGIFILCLILNGLIDA
jgi:hypothetical protein